MRCVVRVMVCAAVFSLAMSVGARRLSAQVPEWANGESVHHGVLDMRAQVAERARHANQWSELLSKHSSVLQQCFTNLPSDGIVGTSRKVSEAAQKFLDSRPQDPTASNQALVEAQLRLTRANEGRRVSGQVLHEASELLAKHRKASASDQSDEAKSRLEAVEVAFAAAIAADSHAEARQKIAQREVDELTEAGKTASTAEGRREQALKDLNEADAALENHVNALSSALAADFDAVLADKGRREACVKVHDAIVSAGSDQAKISKEIDRHSTSAHRLDTLRKAPSLPSGIESGNGLVEAPGSPDKISVALMSALGADSKTDGTRLVSTLNIASLFTPSDEERLKLTTFVRNAFVQLHVPLSSTEGVSPTGSTADETGPAVTRYSFKLGGSLDDETDTRLPTNRDCYKVAWIAAESPLRQDAEEAIRPKRAELFDRCNRIAANKSRLAWRLGLGLATTDQDTEAERLAFAFVWGANSNVFLNGVYQRVWGPNPKHVIGGGLSLAGSMGGTAQSGVTSWSRVGIDVMLLGISDDTTETEDIEVRIAPTLRAKLLDDSIATVAVGPRFLGSRIDDGDVEVLATVGLTFDADALIDSALAGGEPAGR